MPASLSVNTNRGIEKEKTRLNIRKIARPYLLILPAIIGILVFYLYPMLDLVYLSLFRYNIINVAKSKFIGLGNYHQLLADPIFYKVLGNTFIYTIASVFFIIALSLLIAVWINKKTAMDRFMQMGLFTPHIISAVSISFVWMWMMDPTTGFLNFILKMLGLPTLQWLTSSKTALISIIIVTIWRSVGYYTLMMIAALQGIPTSIIEAARLDNAKGPTLFFRITLPLISPQLFFVLVTLTIGSFKVFDTVQIMTSGGPNNATNTLVYYIYEYKATRIGYASAAGVVLMALIGILTYFYFRSLSNKVYYQ